MPFTLLKPSGIDLAQTFAFTGTVTGAGEANTPAWLVRYNGEQSLSDYTTTKVTGWSIETVDTDSAFASDKFTVPSGKAGKYFVFTSLQMKADDSTRLLKTDLKIYQNGGNIAYTHDDYRDNNLRQVTRTISTILDLSVGDYVEVYVAVDVTAGTPAYEGNTKRAIFGGYKITS